MLALVVAIIVTAQVSQAPAAPADVRALTLSSPVTTRTLAGTQFSGEAIRLCPSPDMAQAYARFSERDRWGNETSRHFLVTLRGGGVLPLDGEPTWAGPCWARKSGPASPAMPAFAIKVESREELVRTTNVPREGAIGMHTADPNATLGDVAGNAAMASQKVVFETLTLRGRVIDQGVNRHVLPGRAFGWAPAPLALVAYVNEKGRLALMDSTGRTREVAGTRKVSLPVWSDDGRTLLFLEQKAARKYEVRICEVK